MSQYQRHLPLMGVLFAASAGLFGQTVPDDTADVVYGQSNFNGNTANRGQANPSASTLNGPRDVAIDTAAGGLYVADANNNRVLFYIRGSQTPSVVYGQVGSFETGTANKGGTISANTLREPTGVAVDSTGVYIADTSNHRVLHYPPGSTTADRVYGQNGSFTAGTANRGAAAPDRTSLNAPTSVAVDKAGGLYVADFGNHRVMYYPGNSTLAERVYGQNGSFTTATSNAGGGPNATSLASPEGVAVDSENNLYVGDRENHRVLRFPSGSVIADRVYGQGKSFTSRTENLGGISNESMSRPIGIVVDAAAVFSSPN